MALPVISWDFGFLGSMGKSKSQSSDDVDILDDADAHGKYLRDMSRLRYLML